MSVCLCMCFGFSIHKTVDLLVPYVKIFRRERNPGVPMPSTFVSTLMKPLVSFCSMAVDLFHFRPKRDKMVPREFCPTVHLRLHRIQFDGRIDFTVF